MDHEVAVCCGARAGSHTTGRTNRRNGFRRLVWTSSLGGVELKVPRLRHGTYPPSFLGAAVGDQWVAGHDDRRAGLAGHLCVVHPVNDVGVVDESAAVHRDVAFGCNAVVLDIGGERAAPPWRPSTSR